MPGGGGAGVYAIARKSASPQVPKDLTYDNLKTLLEGHFKPTPLTITELFKFHRCEQKPQKSVSDYVVAIKELAATCEFGEFLQQALRDRLVCGLRSETLQKRLLAEKDLTWTSCQEIAMAMEMAAQGARSFAPGSSGAGKAFRLSFSRC